MRDTYLETIVRRAGQIADAHGASLFLVDGDVLRPIINYNLPEEYISGVGPIRIGTPCCGRAVEFRKPWRNEHFARLIAIAMKEVGPVNHQKPICSCPAAQGLVPTT